MSEAVNSFNNGLVMDFNPITTPNTVLTNCLNGTLITYNGNEYILLNDMGNGRVETAYLPQGYIPIGTTELGGIIYIVSYNPIINKSLIGCFPSPERNITTDEVNDNIVEVSEDNFKDGDNIVNTVVRLDLSANTKFNPGDKFLIYSNAISDKESFETKLSGFGSKNHNIEENPKYVTIHVVSIGDNGEITYLDDSLKWFKNDYYIKNREDLLEDNEVKISKIDLYRNLLQSPYNIFNSKLSGKLALILELELIDTFTATYDITDDYKVSYNVTWTSRHDSINISSVYCTLNESEHKTVGIEGNNWKPTSINGASCNIKISDDTYSKDDILKYTLAPCMPFGIIDFMKVSGTINFSEVGNGEVNLSLWRYYVEDTKMYLQWEMLVNPKPHWKVYKMSYIFIPYNKIDANFSTHNTYSDLISKGYYTFNITRDNAYSGNYLKWVEFEEGKFEKDSLYLVGIFVEWGQSEDSLQYTSKWGWIYTNGLFNSIYYDDPNITNFNEIYLNRVLDIDLDLVSKKALTTVNKEVVGTESEDTIMGMLIIGVDSQSLTYSPILYTTINLKKSDMFKITGGTVKHCIGLYIEEAFNHTGIISLPEEYNKYIEAEDGNTLANIYLRYEKTYQDGIVAITNENIPGRTYIYSLINSENILTRSPNCCDYFRIIPIQLEGDLSFNIEGSIFSRINASMITRNSSVAQIARPLIKNKSDFYKYNIALVDIVSSVKAEETFVIGISQRDLGSGDPMAFAFSRVVRSRSGRDEDTVDTFYESTKEDWNPGDEPNFNKYLDIDPYNEVLNEWMKASGSPIVLVNYNYFKSGDDRYVGKYGNNAILYGTDGNKFYSQALTESGKKYSGWLGAWVRTNNDRYIPINTIVWDDGEDFGKAATQIIAALLLVYRIEEDPNNTIQTTTVNSINRHKKYLETWTLQDTCTCKVYNRNFYLKDINLVNLASWTSGTAKPNNLQYYEPLKDDSGYTLEILKNIEWKFDLDSSNLYEVFKSKKLSNIKCIIEDTTKVNNIQSTKLYNSNYIYTLRNEELIRIDYSDVQVVCDNYSLIYPGQIINENSGELNTSDKIIIVGLEFRPISDTALSKLLIKDDEICFDETGLLALYTPMYYRDHYDDSNKHRIAVRKGNSSLPLLTTSVQGGNN